MPGPEFFRKLRLLVLSDFLDVTTCARLRFEILNAPLRSGRIVGETRPDEGAIDDSIRRVDAASVPKTIKLEVKSKLELLKPKAEEHFKVSLSGCDGPHFLVYGPGAFYKPHQDASPGAPAHILERRVSIIIFLNGAADDPSNDGYRGGELTFYGLMRGPKWQDLAFSLDAPPGLLIAFRPSVLHEVKPVTFGRRITIVAWFTNTSHPDTASESGSADVPSGDV
jgi:SM-20-related protein